MKLLNVSLILLISLVLTGCCTHRYSKFPPPPQYKEVSETPVIGFDKDENVYTITGNTMENFILNKIFLDEILKWRSENNIK